MPYNSLKTSARGPILTLTLIQFYFFCSSEMEGCSSSDSSDSLDSDSDSDSYSSFSSDQCDDENGFTIIRETSSQYLSPNTEGSGSLQTIISSISDASSQCSGPNAEGPGTLQPISDTASLCELSRTTSSLSSDQGESGIISSISDTSNQYASPNKGGSGTLQAISDNPNANFSPIQCYNFDARPRTIQCSSSNEGKSENISTITDSSIGSEGCGTNSVIDKASRTFYTTSGRSNNGCRSSPNEGSQTISYNSSPNKVSVATQLSCPNAESRTNHATIDSPIEGCSPIQFSRRNQGSCTTQFSYRHVGCNKVHANGNSRNEGYSLIQCTGPFVGTRTIHATSDRPNLESKTIRCDACMGPGIGACMGQIASPPMRNGMLTFQSASKVACDKCLSAQHQECISRKLSDSIPESNISSPYKSNVGCVVLDSNRHPPQNILNPNTDLITNSESHTSVVDNTDTDNQKTDSHFMALDLNSNPDQKVLSPDLNQNPVSDLPTTIDDGRQCADNDSALKPASIMSHEDKLRLYIPQRIGNYSSDSETDSSSSDSSSSSNEEDSSNGEDDLQPLLSPMTLLSPISHDPLSLLSPMAQTSPLSPMSPVSILHSPLSPCSVIQSPIGESPCLPTLEYDPLLITNYAVTHRLSDS